ncbi:MAG: penicillin acylase family protein [Pyrinomonadaceae bacterium]
MNRFVLLVFLFAVFCFSGFSQSPATEISVAGLSAPVMVRRDSRSIPYIEAKSDADVYFAQGYTTASDRLFQMDLMRRLSRGETAEIFGRSVLEEDKRWRRFNFAKIAEESIQFMAPKLQAALASYAKGVNAYIATLDDKTLPVEFRILQYKPREWKPSDTIMIGKILSDALSSTWRNDILRLSMQGLPKDKLEDLTNPVTPFDVILFGTDSKTAAPAAAQAVAAPNVGNMVAMADREEATRRSSLERVGLYAEDLAASNNWVISGKRTVDGKPILANDPHLAPTAPGIWYLTHLSTPTMRVSGVTVPGVPGIILGHNADIAWGATNVGPDVQDIYSETFNEKGEYKTPTGWEPAVKRTESIKVRSNPLKPETETVTIDVLETRNGPIISEEGGKKYALKWTAFDPRNSEFEVFYDWNRAKNWEGFKTALKKYGGAAQNFVYADTKGNIGWYAASKIPIRRVGDGAMPYDGATSDGDWVGFIPFDELPNLYNPPSGLIITANQRIVGTSYKYPQMSRDAATPWRAREILTTLESKPKLTVDDVRRAQYDNHSIPVHEIAREIVKRGAASAETLAVLKDWDGRMSPDSQAALLASDIRICLSNKIADSNRPVPGTIIRERVLYWAVKENSARWLPAGFKDYGELIRSCDTAVRAGFADPKRYGPDQSTWTWGRIWQSRFPHPLAVAPLIGVQFQTPNVPINGSGQTPNVGSSVSMRHIATPGNWDTTSHVIPLGQSGDPKSPHFKDQFDAWSTGMTLVFPFTKAAVDKATKATVILAPL